MATGIERMKRQVDEALFKNFGHEIGRLRKKSNGTWRAACKNCRGMVTVRRVNGEWSTAGLNRRCARPSKRRVLNG